MDISAPPKQICLLCGRDKFIEFPQSVQLKSVSSDCKPLERGGLIMVCLRCGHVQKRLDGLWQNEVARIYANYTMYHLSGGIEQVIFKNDSHIAFPRSEQILQHLEQEVDLPTQGELLDFGCGNGELLRLFNRRFPRWNLAGYDQDDRYRKEVTQIPRVKNFYSNGLETIERKFNLITLIHVLEHISQPYYLLKQLREKLTRDGLLFIHVPNCLQNPFDLVVLDHCSHFILEKLVELIQSSGFEVITSATNWIPNYITLIARLQKHEYLQKQKLKEVDINGISKIVVSHIRWLNDLYHHARRISDDLAEFGIFGTAIAGTWLGGLLGSGVDFFVDEDLLRIGKEHIGHRVIYPFDVSEDSQVYLALPFEVARCVYNRFKKVRPTLKLICPPDVLNMVAVTTY